MFNKRLIQAALAGLLIATPAFAQHDHMAGMASASVSGVDYAFEGPETLETGYTTLTFSNDGQELHHLQLARLNDGVTLEQFIAALQQGEQVAMPLIELIGGVGMVPPGHTATTTVNLEKPGTYVELCFVPNAEGVPHLALGMLKPIEVVAARDTSAEAPKADLVVDMKDFAFSIPEQVMAGEQVWEVVNHGPQPHELILGKIKDGKTMADVMAYLQAGMQGEPSVELMGGAQGLSSEHSSFVTFTLTPGEYVALCFIPDPATGQPHLALGMLSHFTAVATLTQR